MPPQRFFARRAVPRSTSHRFEQVLISGQGPNEAWAGCRFGEVRITKVRRAIQVEADQVTGEIHNLGEGPAIDNSRLVLKSCGSQCSKRRHRPQIHAKQRLGRDPEHKLP